MKRFLIGILAAAAVAYGGVVTYFAINQGRYFYAPEPARDAIVPFSDGEAIHAAASKPKMFVRMPGCGHIEIWSDPARGAILQFLRARIGAAPQAVP